MFQAYRMKLVKNNYPGIRSYRYQNCSIAVSKEDGKLEISIAPHDYEKEPSLPEKDELNGILSYLGFNPDAPYETYQVEHRGIRGFGNTHYFVQPM